MRHTEFSMLVSKIIDTDNKVLELQKQLKEVQNELDKIINIKMVSEATKVSGTDTKQKTKRNNRWFR